MNNLDIPIDHPYHLHGRYFYIVARGEGRITASNYTSLTFTTRNPPRRDSVRQLPIEPIVHALMVTLLSARYPASIIRCFASRHRQPGGVALPLSYWMASCWYANYTAFPDSQRTNRTVQLARWRLSLSGLTPSENKPPLRLPSRCVSLDVFPTSRF